MSFIYWCTLIPYNISQEDFFNHTCVHNNGEWPCCVRGYNKKINQSAVKCYQSDSLAVNYLCICEQSRWLYEYRGKFYFNHHCQACTYIIYFIPALCAAFKKCKYHVCKLVNNFYLFGLISVIVSCVPFSVISLFLTCCFNALTGDALCTSTC